MFFGRARKAQMFYGAQLVDIEVEISLESSCRHEISIAKKMPEE
jgi:hypothetical protein